MYDEYEPEGLLISYTIENQHGLDSEVPGTCAIGRGYDDCEIGHHERYQCTTDTKFCGKVEAEKRQVIMQEIHHPDADGEEQVERQVLDPPQGEYPLPDSTQRHLYLIIYREVL